MTPERIREAADTVLARPEYDLGEREVYAWDFSWFWALLEWIFDPFFRLLETLSSLPPSAQYVVYGILTVVLVALIAHLIYTTVMAFRRDRFEAAAFDDPKPVTVEDLAETAQQHAANGDFVEASRALYKGALLMLEEKREGRLRKGLTNTEYLRTFHAPWVVDNLRVFVDLINWKWYRDNRFEKADYEACQAAYDRIAARLREEFS